MGAIAVPWVSVSRLLWTCEGLKNSMNRMTGPDLKRFSRFLARGMESDLDTIQSTLVAVAQPNRGRRHDDQQVSVFLCSCVYKRSELDECSTQYQASFQHASFSDVVLDALDPARQRHGRCRSAERPLHQHAQQLYDNVQYEAPNIRHHGHPIQLHYSCPVIKSTIHGHHI